jgi:hypothetical protein
MTTNTSSSIYPQSLTSLPHPWNLTNTDNRNDLVDQLEHSHENITTALLVLQRSLDYEVTHPRVVPAQFGGLFPEDFFLFLIQWNKSFTTLMPTLDTVTIDHVYHWLNHNPHLIEGLHRQTHHNPTYDIAEKITLLSTNGTTEEIAEKAAWWLGVAIRRSPDDDRITHSRITLIELCKHYIPLLDLEMAHPLLATIWFIAPPHSQDEFYRHIENNPDLDPNLRAEAKKYRETVLN